MKKILFATIAALALFAVPARAENCAVKAGFAAGPWSPLYDIADGYFQWLNHGYFNCSGDTNSVTCSHNSEQYTLVLSANGNYGTVLVYVPGNGWWIHNAQYAMQGSGMSSWSWDSGVRTGRLTITCHPDPYNPCASYDYGTCD